MSFLETIMMCFWENNFRKCIFVEAILKEQFGESNFESFLWMDPFVCQNFQFIYQFYQTSVNSCFLVYAMNFV